MVIQTDGQDGLLQGPIVALFRNSASPAAFDLLGRILFEGGDDQGTPARTTYASITAQIKSPANTTEDGMLRLETTVNAINNVRLFIESGIYTPNGVSNTDQGADTVNAVSFYSTNTKVVGVRQTGWAATTGTELRTNFGDASLSDTSQALRALIVDLKTHGLIGA
jgi:hypothetical protein